MAGKSSAGKMAKTKPKAHKKTHPKAKPEKKKKKKHKRKIKIALPQLQSLNLRPKEGFASTKTGINFKGKVKKIYQKHSPAFWKDAENKAQHWQRRTMDVETVSGDKFPVALWTATERPVYEFPEYHVQTSKVSLKHPAAKHAAYLSSRLQNLEIHLLIAQQKLRQMKGQEPSLTLGDIKGQNLRVHQLLGDLCTDGQNGEQADM